MTAAQADLLSTMDDPADTDLGFLTRVSILNPRLRVSADPLSRT